MIVLLRIGETIDSIDTSMERVQTIKNVNISPLTVTTPEVPPTNRE